MQEFIEVTAYPCNSSGQKGMQSIPVDLKLNPSIIIAIRGKDVLVAGNGVLNINNEHFKDIRLKK
jgi:hypothetical protein